MPCLNTTLHSKSTVLTILSHGGLWSSTSNCLLSNTRGTYPHYCLLTIAQLSLQTSRDLLLDPLSPFMLIFDAVNDVISYKNMARVTVIVTKMSSTHFTTEKLLPKVSGFPESQTGRSQGPTLGISSPPSSFSETFSKL